MKATTLSSRVEITRRVKLIDAPYFRGSVGWLFLPDIMVVSFTPDETGTWEVTGPVKLCGPALKPNNEPSGRRINVSRHDWGSDPALTTLIDLLRPSGRSLGILTTLTDYEVQA